MKKIILVLFIILLCICSLSYADITVQWDANTESDLAGYKVYYDQVTQCPDGEDTCSNPDSLYNGTGAVEGSSPITFQETLANPEFTLTGLDPSKDWFISVTAFDNETPALESDLSNQVVALKGAITPPIINLEETTLQWDSNTEEDLAGYKVYYDTDTGAPYSGTGALVYNGLPADSPIDIPLTAPGFDPNNPEFTLKLDGCFTWYFTVTAFDTEHLESDYSNEVSDPENCAPEPPTGVIVIITPIQ